MRINFNRIALLPMLTAGIIFCFSCTKEKKAVHVESVTLDREELELIEGERDTLKVTVLPAKAPQGVVWSSSDEDVATVGADGDILAIKPGNATIKVVAEDNGIEASCELTVKKLIIPVASVSLDKKTLPILKGGNYTFSATVLPENATDKSLSWKSDNEDVAMVNQQGKVVGAEVGTAHIIVASTQYPEVTDTCTVTVESETVAVTGISVSPGSLTLVMGTSGKLTATIAPGNATNQSVRWQSGNTSKVKVDNGGNLTPVAAGEADVTATSVEGGFSAKCHVRVVDNPVTALAFAQASATPIRLEYGSTMQLDIVFTPENPSNKGLNWSFSPTNIVTLQSYNSDPPYAIIYGKNTGSTTIQIMSTVTTSTTATQAVYVWRNPSAIEPSADKLTLSVGASAPLSAVFTPSNATETGVSFSSSDNGVASVDENGNVSGVAAGTATITITSTAVPSLTCTCAVKVQGENKVKINGGDPLSFETGSLSTVLKDSSVNSIFFPEALLNSVDVVALNAACKSATDVDISNVSFLANGASYKISGLSDSYKLNDPEALPAAIFYECIKITKLRLPAIKKLSSYSLNSCRQLSDLVLPDTVEELEGFSMGRTWALESMDFSHVKIIGAYSFSNSGLSGELDLSNVEQIGSTAFSCAGLTKVWLGSALKTIGSNPFPSSCKNLTGIFFKEENERFKSDENGWLFSKDGKKLYLIPMAAPGATGTVTVPQGVEVVAGECGNNLSLTELVLPEGLVEFDGMYAFGNYKGTTLTLPSTLIRMSALTFGYGKMTTITVKAVTPPTITNYTQYGAFAHCEALTAIYVPAESVERYKAATGWSFHKDIIQAIPSE